MKKYEILMDEENTIVVYGKTLHRIKALKDFGDVKKGDIGGYIENEYNLSQEGDCWIYDDAMVFDNARVYSHAKVYDGAKAYSNAKVYGNAILYGNAIVCDNAMVYGNSRVYGNARVFGNAKVYDNAEIYGNAKVCDNAKVYGNARVCNIKIQGTVSSNFDDIIEIQNPKGRLVTCTLHEDKILYTLGCQSEIDEETFKDRIENEDGGIENNPHRKYYYKIIEASKIILLNK